MRCYGWYSLFVQGYTVLLRILSCGLQRGYVRRNGIKKRLTGVSRFMVLNLNRNYYLRFTSCTW